MLAFIVCCTGALAISTTFLCGCSARPPRASATPAINHPDCVDLQRGWRVRVVTPLTRSGKYTVETKAVAVEGNSIEVKASDDLLGYEEDFYGIKRTQSGIAIRFKSATVHLVNGKASREEPALALFGFPQTIAFVRLLFLTRESRADYDGAILAASSLAELDSLTRAVEADPGRNCAPHGQSICRWIPLGISVQPQPGK